MAEEPSGWGNCGAIRSLVTVQQLVELAALITPWLYGRSSLRQCLKPHRIVSNRLKSPRWIIALLLVVGPRSGHSVRSEGHLQTRCQRPCRASSRVA